MHRYSQSLEGKQIARPHKRWLNDTELRLDCLQIPGRIYFERVNRISTCGVYPPDLTLHQDGL